MNRIMRTVIISCLVDKLRDEGSWCGETHIQKAGYFLQELAKVPLGFKFVMYKHGPFSFDLRDELTVLRADGLLELSVEPPYGPRFVTTVRGKELQGSFSQTMPEHEIALNFVANKLGNRKVSDLERLATALFVTLNADDSEQSTDKRAAQFHHLKRHIPEDIARQAIHEIDQIICESKNCILPSVDSASV